MMLAQWCHDVGTVVSWYAKRAKMQLIGLFMFILASRAKDSRSWSPSKTEILHKAIQSVA